MRILHILGSLEIGGAETWLLQIVRYIDLNKYKIDLLIHKKGGAYENMLRALGCNIIYIKKENNYIKYIKNLYDLLKEGKYDIVHSHVLYYSGLIMKLSDMAKVKGRITHIRNSFDGKKDDIIRNIYRTMGRYFILKYSTEILAVSKESLKSILGLQYKRGIIMTGIEVNDYKNEKFKALVRSNKTTKKSYKQVSHIGNFRRQKNQEHIIEIAKETSRLKLPIKFILIGDGPDKKRILGLIESNGLTSHIQIIKPKVNVPEIMASSDAFIFPSLYEGLPRVVLEAQAAGLCPLVSSKVTKEIEIYSGSVLYENLNASLNSWISKLEMAIRMGINLDRSEKNIEILEQKGLTIEKNAKQLMSIYELYE